MSWSRAFHLPIPLPDGRVLRTLPDAGEYIQELPRSEKPTVFFVKLHGPEPFHGILIRW
jgi:hypothetical protein